MLRDAALLQLDLNRRALREDLTLKDASPYNVQFRGTAPVFIDIGSFERLRPGEPWAGYRQFCMLYLYPLMLQAYKDLPYHAALRGALDGIPPHDARAALAGERFRRGVVSNVLMHARMEDRYSGTAGRDVKREMQQAGFGKQVMDATLGKLEKLVRGLEWKAGETAWTGYGEDNTYDEARRRAQGARSCARRRRAGARRSSGTSAPTTAPTRAIAAESAGLVVAFDADHATVDALYRRLRDEGRTDILPARHVGHRPVARPGLARARARVAGAARDAGARPLPRRRAPRLHHRQRARARVPGLAGRARGDARDRVPRPGRPDGPAAAERQARRREPRLRARALRARARASASTSSAASRCRRRARSTRPGRGCERPGAARDRVPASALHLGALWALAFAQPLLDLLGRNAEFFVARGSTRGDILAAGVRLHARPAARRRRARVGARVGSGPAPAGPRSSCWSRCS